MELEIVNQLSESKIFNSVNRFDDFEYRKTADYLYLNVIVWYLLIEELNSKKSKEYISRTMAFNNFNHFRTSETDLYMLIYNLLGNNDDYKYHSDVMKNSRLDETQLKEFFYRLRSKNIYKRWASQYFYRLERQLKINSVIYRGMRRKILSWDTLTLQSKQKLFNDIRYWTRHYSPRAELQNFLPPPSYFK